MDPKLKINYNPFNFGYNILHISILYDCPLYGLAIKENVSACIAPVKLYFKYFFLML